MTTKKWKQSKDPLFRGDRKDGIGIPDPSADDSIVRHVLFLEGPGRRTPFLSTSEQYDLAEHFAQAGAVWKVYVMNAKKKNVKHISNSELLGLMRGNGKGKAKWPEPYEVMQARRYVELGRTLA
jgi:hypothetical protein